MYYTTIEFNDGGTLINYTDCWEISVLRLLHFLFGKGGVMSEPQLTGHMDMSSSACEALVTYFRENPTYYLDDEYYKGKDGLALRAVWCQFINKSGLFHLKKERKYEVAATLPNILTFFRCYFPRLKVDFSAALPLTLKGVVSREYFHSY